MGKPHCFSFYDVDSGQNKATINSAGFFYVGNDGHVVIL
jgi:hypothetical protein